jgi:hypothetical protein
MQPHFLRELDGIETNDPAHPDPASGRFIDFLQGSA